MTLELEDLANQISYVLLLSFINNKNIFLFKDLPLLLDKDKRKDYICP